MSEATTSAGVPGTAANGAGRGNLQDRVRSLRLNQLEQRGTAPANRLPWGVAIVFACLSLWMGVQLFSEPKRPTEEEAAATANADATARPAANASSGSSGVAAAGEIALEAKGYIIPAHQILVSPKVSGMVEQLNFIEGKRVNKGDVLAVIEKTDYEADLTRAKANVSMLQFRLNELENGSRPQEITQVEAEVAEAQAQLKQLDLQYKREGELVKKQTISQQQYEETESKHSAMSRRVARLSAALELMREGPRSERKRAAEAELQQAKAELEKAQWRLGNTEIRAPITGTILKKNAEEGNIVNAIAFNGSFSLCDMADLSDLEVDLNIQERDISRVFVGQKCRVRAEAYMDRTYEGRVDRLMPIADRAKGAVPVRVKIKIPADEEGVYLKPEMGAIVTFLNGKPMAAEKDPPSDEGKVSDRGAGSTPLANLAR